MDKKIFESFQKKINKLKKNEPFLVTFSIYSEKASKGKELETFLFINNFPYEEIAGIKQEINRLLNEADKK
ncbi:MAG: hypothetical protein UU87_C0003G0009 [Parcubacteria group bacterium GW2011_GWA2_42_11]|nr:MAG: hypothetical protein UU87_C0003G0009 [Parcubacteria group bacterium GW2011_GWA2_42_11]